MTNEIIVVPADVLSDPAEFLPAVVWRQMHSMLPSNRQAGKNPLYCTYSLLSVLSMLSQRQTTYKYLVIQKLWILPKNQNYSRSIDAVSNNVNSTKIGS